MFFANGLLKTATCGFYLASKTLDISNCELEALPVGLQEYTATKRLLASNNNIQELPSFLYEGEQLVFKYLDVRANNIAHLPIELVKRWEEVEGLKVEGNPAAEVVNWGGHGLNENNFPGRELMLYVNQTLTELRLHDNDFSSKAFKYFSESVGLKEQLVKLDLSKNNLTGVMHHGALQTLFPHLIMLNVSRNERITNLNDEALLPVETMVDFSHCGITEDPTYDTTIKLQYHNLDLHGNRFPYWVDAWSIKWYQWKEVISVTSNCGDISFDPVSFDPPADERFYSYFYAVKNLVQRGYVIDNYPNRGSATKLYPRDSSSYTGKLKRFPSWYSHFSVSNLVTTLTGIEDFFAGNFNENLERLVFQHAFQMTSLRRNDGAFDNLPKLNTLDFLNLPLLASLEDGVFKNNHEVRHVRIIQCAFAEFDVSKIFSPEAKLEHLDLSWNQISEIRPHSFAGQSEMKVSE